MPPADEARRYIATFRKHTLPGTDWVDTDRRRIMLDDMSDDDALFVAREFRAMEAVQGCSCRLSFKRLRRRV